MVKIRCSILKISCYKVHISIYLHSCPTCKQLADFERDSVPRPGSPAFQGEGGRGGGRGGLLPASEGVSVRCIHASAKNPNTINNMPDVQSMANISSICAVRRKTAIGAQRA